MQINFQIFDDPAETSRAVAELIKEKTQIISDSEFLNIAVSGGSTPRLLFELLGEEYETSVNWKKVRLFWVDERCVEPTNPESNYGMTYDAFLQRTFVPGDNIFRIHGEEIPEYEADRYQKLLLKELPAKNGFPVFDLILLGMGEDGHIASLFPKGDQLDIGLDPEYSDLVIAMKAPNAPEPRLTLTARAILSASEIHLLIQGVEKMAVLRAAQMPGSAQDLPVRLLLQHADHRLNVHFSP